MATLSTSSATIAHGATTPRCAGLTRGRWDDDPVQAFLGRDFMPFGPPEGKPLAAIVNLSVPPPATFPTSISAVYIWAIRDSSDVWSATMTHQAIDPTRMTCWAGNGPLWDPDIFVDVVVGARTSPTTVSLALLRDVPITKTY